jgi:ferritin-like protein
MSSGYIEQDLSVGVRNVHRALASLQEELEAIDYYNQRADRSEDGELKAILIHNRDEEIEHASMLFEYLRRRMPEFDSKMKRYLFIAKPVTEIEAGGTAPACDLGLAGLKPSNP